MLEVIGLLIAYTCPTFGYVLPTDWKGQMYIAGAMAQMPGPGVELAVKLWDESGFVDARICREGERVEFVVPRGAYRATVNVKGSESDVRRYDVQVGYRQPCGVCHGGTEK